MAGTLYNLTLDATINLKENKSNAIVGSMKISAKEVGKSEEKAMEKASGGLKFDLNELSELLQK